MADDPAAAERCHNRARCSPVALAREEAETRRLLAAMAADRM